MSDQTKNREETLWAAVEGDSDALGELLASHRPYLKILAQRYLDDRLHQRVSDSDLIQQTCVSAVRFIASFKGRSEAEFAAWLRTILERHAFDIFRENTADKRNLNRERSLGDASSQEAFLVDLNMSSPSQRLLRGEMAVELARMLDQLPDRQREAIRLKYLEGMTLTEVAESMGTTPYSVVGLLNRGLKSIRQQMQNLSRQTNK